MVYCKDDNDLHALMVCVCVLFEDLPIGVSGITEDALGGLDECGKETRRLYFLRRSTATLHEFTTILCKLDQLPSFQLIKAGFDFVS